MKYIFGAFIAAPLFFVGTGSLLTGCGPETIVDPIDTPPTPVVKDTAGFGFTVSFKDYQVLIDKSQTICYYDKVSDITTINGIGYSTKDKLGATITSKAEILIEFPGKSIANFDQNSANFKLEIATGENATRIESKNDGTGAVDLKVTKYGEVGQKVEGTFTATLKSGINQRSFTKGHFSIERNADQ
ncbi:MAG: hypothetical protein H6607_10450 [Flavobacteriales bacterium]|nr:hypothetical protein [Flavobacteriales bacterium]